jgi:thiol:disulfide interchange protein DsbD
MNLINRSTVTTWIVALLFLPNALAAPVNSGHLEAELISEVSSVKPGEPLWVAVKQVIRPGWHTYWRNPGDAGAQAKLDWQLPTGFTASEIHWPYPERIPYGPLMNFGYHDEVMLLVQITTPGTFDADEVRLQVKGEWLVCEDICIPEDAELELVLPVADAMPHLVMEHAGYFQDARQKLPRDIGVGAQFSAAEDKIILSIQMSGLERSRIESVEFFPYGEGVLDYPRPQKLSVINDGFRLALTPGYRFDPLKSNLDGVIVVTEAAGGGLQSAFVVQPSRSEVIESDEISLPLALVFAFLGGMILNLMPCVFPVLSIKVLSLIESTHANAGVIRIHALIYVLGVVSSFLVIALVLIALRESGEQIGWGFQLQSPIVIGLLCYLFVVIGLNLAGYFEFGTSLMGAGGGLADRSGHSGSFFTGVLAALVAAPCTAPFMGAAIGYALTQNTFTSLAIFTSLGLGMAIPYVLLCFSPPLLDRLPKPGRWMETLRQVFAFPMFATSVWLIWVLNQQTGANGLLAVLTGLLLIVFAIWLLKRQVAGAGRWVGRFVALFLSVIALGLTGVVGTSSSASEETAEAVSIGASGLAAEPYSRERLEELVASGPVFVNFSAAWCITCKVNELAALSSDGIRLTFEKNNVICLKADWTNEDPAITKALSEYGRSGVPLYLLYKKGSSRASILPQILTESIVIEAIEAL